MTWKVSKTISSRVYIKLIQWKKTQDKLIDDILNNKKNTTKNKEDISKADPSVRKR